MLGLIYLLFQNILSSGNRNLAATIGLKLFNLLKFKFKGEFLKNYCAVIENTRPLILYKTMYIGGKKYKIPTIMPVSKSYNIATR